MLFARSEFDDRLARLRQRMAASAVDVALFDEMEPMAWISGYANSQNRYRCVVVPRDGEPFFLIRSLDAGPMRQRSWIADVVTFRDWEDPMPVLAAKLRQRGLDRARLALDFNSYGMSLARFQQLRDNLPGASIVDMGPAVWELRLRKSPAELDLVRKAAVVADRAMEEAIAACVEGSSQRKAAEVASAAFIRLGADAEKVGPISAGKGWDFLHAHVEDKRLAPGDTVHLELVPKISGYCARLMRCVSIGAPTREAADQAESLAALQLRQIEAMVPGALARDVDAILREGAVKAGLRQSYDNISGYTLGYYHSATPRTSDFTRIFHPQADWRIEPGMVFHMYASGIGIAFSETVIVHEHGPERLSKLPRKLFVNG
jgi:Xaa-Pro aminopeptidase